MTDNIIIPNPEKLKKVEDLFAEDGAGRLLVLADFDKTLTTAYINGNSIVSLISILRDGNYLTSDYADKAHMLYNKYHPIEIDSKISLDEKKKLMFEWWSAHFDLLIKSGLNKQDIKRAVDSGKIRLRNGFKKFAEILHPRNVPLVILSASGMGTEAISICLEKEGLLHDNIYIISNSFEWDKNGKAVRVKQPIIHTFNKSAIAIKNSPFFEKIREKMNVLLLGDTVDDANMAQGFDHNNLIKVGFLNENPENNIEIYKKAYDILILDDGSLEYINEFLGKIIA
jgi:5'-nucleotidase